MRRAFEIPGRLPGANEWTRACKQHHSKAGRMKREAQDLIIRCIRAARIEPVQGRVIVHFTWVEPNMRRDYDNIAFAKKFVFDALQEAGTIPNDNWRYVEGFSDTFRLNRKNPRVIVEIEEA